jgi:acylphosphatase
MSSKHLIVRGTVQGVFFRSSAAETAGDLGLAGWVRNREDGSVEMVVEGADDAVDRMVDWAGRGPEQAEVSDVEVTDRDPEGLDGFRQV